MQKLNIEYDFPESALLHRELIDQIIKENPKIKNRQQAMNYLFEAYFQDVKKRTRYSPDKRKEWEKIIYNKFLKRAQKEQMRIHEKETKIRKSQIKEMIKIIREHEKSKMKSKIQNLKNANAGLLRKCIEKDLNIIL